MSKKHFKPSVEDPDSKALQRKASELNRALEQAKVKINSLETLIKASMEENEISWSTPSEFRI